MPDGNPRLKTAAERAGLDADQIADLLQVDVKTVRRWLTGSVPYPKHRIRLARALGVEQQELWPELATPAEPAKGSGSEHAAEIYTAGSDPAAPDPIELVQQAEHHVALMDTTLKHLIADARFIPAITDRANAGCRIRVLIADPESIHLTIAWAETNPDAELSDPPPAFEDLYAILDQLRALSDHDNIEIRVCVATPYNSIIEVDQEMLVGLNLAGLAGSDAPLLHLDRDGQPNLFERFANHYQHVWDSARPTLT